MPSTIILNCTAQQLRQEWIIIIIEKTGIQQLRFPG